MKQIIAIFISILLIINFTIYTGSKTIYVENGQSIQAAINNASDGDTIIIKGIFHESIFINKTIKLIGENATIYGKNGSVISINSDGVIIKNITILHSDEKHAVIDANRNAEIKKCNISYGRYGIIAKHSIIDSCNISYCGGGVWLENDSIVSNLHAYKCGLGIECYGSNNKISKCRIHTCGVAIYFENASNNVIERCDVYKNNNNEGDIFFLSSSENVIKDCNISYVSFGLRMVKSNENLVERCSIFGTRYGIKMEYCNDNKIIQSSIDSNRFGVTLEECKRIKCNYNDLENKMFNLQAEFSICDARHNYWGHKIPIKIKNKGSIVIKTPWLLNPIYGRNVKENIKKMQKNFQKASNHINFMKITTDDFDPLVDIKVTFLLERIRCIDGDRPSKIKVYIDGKENESIFSKDSMPYWKALQNVDDSKQIVEIKIEIGSDKKQIHYDLATGNWYGDDFLMDCDGYGHIKMKNNEIWFDIYYNDYDGDNLTYWEETNIYHTSPYEDDSEKDFDNDSIPCWWEDKYGFDPFKWNDFKKDEDNDGLNDFEEYYMSKNLSDPFAKDIFTEVDYMDGYKMPYESIEMLCDSFSKHNITIHIFLDEEIPYKERVYYNDVRNIYWKYFLHENMDNIKHGIFHYALLAPYSSIRRGGHCFVGWDNLDSFVLAGKYIDKWRVGEGRKIAYASLFMHELGHTLGLFEYTFPGIDNESCNAPWLPGYWIYRNYKSCLNYRYAFQLVDYSNGKNGRIDFDDWDNIDLTFFKDSYYYP